MINGQALDNYITGHYGEDQFKDHERRTRKPRGARAAILKRYPDASCEYRILSDCFEVKLHPDCVTIASSANQNTAWRRALKRIDYLQGLPERERRGSYRHYFPHD